MTLTYPGVAAYATKCRRYAEENVVGDPKAGVRVRLGDWDPDSEDAVLCRRGSKAVGEMDWAAIYMVCR
jgi:hypothetical protein